MDPFLVLLYSVSAGLSSSDLTQLKFLCQNHISKRKLELAQSGLDLFTVLLQQNELNAEHTALLRELADAGTTILVSTHDLQVLPELADEAILLMRRVIAQGAPTEVITTDNLVRAFGLDPLARPTSERREFGRLDSEHHEEVS